MATISYVNDALPIGGLSFNPAFEQVLDTTPTIGAATAKTFELKNNNTGPFKDFKIEFTSNVNNGNGDFTFTTVNGVTKPTAGTITGLWLRAPDNTAIAQVLVGTAGFGSASLSQFFNTLTHPSYANPATAISTALNVLFGNNNVVLGSPVADRLTAYGNTTELSGEGGNDVLWARGSYSRKLVGGDGNDILRVENGTYQIHGANADGSGGAGQTDTLEIVGYVNNTTYAEIDRFTNIDVLRFVATDQPPPGSLKGAQTGARFNLAEIAIGLPKVLAVQGSSAASPLSTNSISIFTPYDEKASAGIKIDISGWTFKTWNEERNALYVSTNSAAKALNDVVVGSMVADEIHTYYGNDTLRGGGGADQLYGGDGNDAFVYGLKEAMKGEYVEGGSNNKAGGNADTVLVLADNDFTGVEFWSIERLKFGGKGTAAFEQDVVGNPMAVIIGDGNANTVAIQLKNATGKAPGVDLSGLTFQSWTDGVDKIVVKGTNAQEIITGSSRNDMLAGGEGRDVLQGGKGADAFVFDARLRTGVDLIADFNRKQGDKIWLDSDIFKKLKAGKLKKSAFDIARKADDKKDRILYDKKSGDLRYDDDGNGKHKAYVIATLDDVSKLKAADFLVI